MCLQQNRTPVWFLQCRSQFCIWLFPMSAVLQPLPCLIASICSIWTAFSFLVSYQQKYSFSWDHKWIDLLCKHGYCKHLLSLHLVTFLMFFLLVYRSLAKKGPWALYLTLSPDKGVGGYLWHRCINYEKAPTYVYITLNFNGYCTSTYRLVQVNSAI